jgi:hypothetical protein
MEEKKRDLVSEIYRLKGQNKINECKEKLKKWFNIDFSKEKATYYDLELLELFREVLDKQERTLHTEVLKYMNQTKMQLVLNVLKQLKEKYKSNKDLEEILESVEENIKKRVIKL